MKKVILIFVAMFTLAISADAMTYEQARKEALFLTDKMAYELNLTNAQYEAAYEINLDYLMSVTGHSDVFGIYWERRNLDMSYILLDWQLRAYKAASYFFRPLYWEAGYWRFGIYARYPRRHYLYFGRPVFYSSYRGGHSWRMNGDRSYYHGRRNHFVHTGSRNHSGMRDGWNRGDFKHNTGRGSGSSTRVTVNNNGGSRGSFGQHRDEGRRTHNVEHSKNDRNGVNSDNTSRNNNTVRNRGSFSSSRPTGTLRSGNSAHSRNNTSSVSSSRNNRSNTSVSTSRSTSCRRSSAHTSSSRSTSSRSSNGGGRFGGQR